MIEIAGNKARYDTALIWHVLNFFVKIKNPEKSGDKILAW